jgi:hypothetical protein
MTFAAPKAEIGRKAETGAALSPSLAQQKALDQSTKNRYGTPIIPRLCNGSTADSGSACGGSNPPWGILFLIKNYAD